MNGRPDPRWQSQGIEFAMHDAMPLGWRHPVTGRKHHRDDPALERLGTYLRRSRYIAGRSQDSVAAAAHVPQGQISRLERALAPAMNVERLAWIEDALDGAFPLGYCPHDHVCEWRKLKPRRTAEEEWAAEVEKQEELNRAFYPERYGIKPDESDGDDSDLLDLLVGE